MGPLDFYPGRGPRRGLGKHARGAINGVVLCPVPRKFLIFVSENGTFWCIIYRVLSLHNEHNEHHKN